MIKRWLILSNCQATGLANCLRLLGPGIAVDAHSASSLPRVLPDLLSKIDSYDSVFIADAIRNRLPNEILGGTVPIPALYFDAYHPDLCYLNTADGATAKGALQDYHSLIAWCGFQLGLSETRTVAFFNGKTYEQLGWYQLWSNARSKLLHDLETSLGTDMTHAFVRWSAGEPFMHSVNHPRIQCLRDVALAMLERASVHSNRTSLTPPDNLLTSAVFPVYPEIAEAQSIPGGSYIFKIFNEYRCLDLKDFVHASYEFYGSTHGLNVRNSYRERYNKTLKYMRENA